MASTGRAAGSAGCMVAPMRMASAAGARRLQRLDRPVLRRAADLADLEQTGGREGLHVVVDLPQAGVGLVRRPHFLARRQGDRQVHARTLGVLRCRGPDRRQRPSRKSQYGGRHVRGAAGLGEVEPQPDGPFPRRPGDQAHVAGVLAGNAGAAEVLLQGGEEPAGHGLGQREDLEGVLARGQDPAGAAAPEGGVRVDGRAGQARVDSRLCAAIASGHVERSCRVLLEEILNLIDLRQAIERTRPSSMPATRMSCGSNWLMSTGEWVARNTCLFHCPTAYFTALAKTAIAHGCSDVSGSSNNRDRFPLPFREQRDEQEQQLHVSIAHPGREYPLTAPFLKEAGVHRTWLRSVPTRCRRRWGMPRSCTA